MPGTLFPCVVTLRDATFQELIFVLGVTKMNKRYGAATSRIGRMDNHILGIYCGIEEGPANLFLSQEVARRLAIDNGGMNSENLNKVLYSHVLDIEKVKGLVKQAFDEEIQTLNIKALTDKEVKEFVDNIKEDEMKKALKEQEEKALAFFQRVNEKPKGKKKEKGTKE